jgi:predicted SnoaL-like aldol condensation-catalyzing enzyme
MKMFVLPLAIGATVVLASCNDSKTSAATSNTDSSSAMMSQNNMNNTEEQNLAKNRSIYNAIETGDSATIRPLIADDAVDHQGPGSTDLKGGANITHMLTDMHNHVKDIHFDVVSDAAKGDYVFTMVDMKGTATDNSYGMPAGSKMDGRSVDVVKIKDGKMVEHWGFMDMADVMKMQQQHPMDNSKMNK